MRISYQTLSILSFFGDDDANQLLEQWGEQESPRARSETQFYWSLQLDSHGGIEDDMFYLHNPEPIIRHTTLPGMMALKGVPGAKVDADPLIRTSTNPGFPVPAYRMDPLNKS